MTFERVQALIQDFIKRALPLVAHIGSDPNDDDGMRSQKSLLVLGSFMFILAGVLWGLLYLLLNQPVAGAIPLSYAFLSFLSLIVFHLTRHYQFFLFSQLLLALLLPFFLTIVLGGFLRSSAFILWSLLSPIGALLFDERPRRALRWLAAFLALMVLSAFLEARPPGASPLPPILVNLFFLPNIGIVSSIVILLLAYFIGRKNRLFRLLGSEREKSENLLLNILPKEIAGILKNESPAIADDSMDASVMFADVVGFAPFSDSLSPRERVELSSEIFAFFDSLMDAYGVEKIRTIGDSYMVASGVARRRHDHAQALVRMALEMRDHIAQYQSGDSPPVNFRIGINSGPMIAGATGRRKFVYDVWGDAVNVASRVESDDLVATIHITRATYELIKDEFVCELRGAVNLKGKRAMEVWHVMGLRAKER